MGSCNSKTQAEGTASKAAPQATQQQQQQQHKEKEKGPEELVKIADYFDVQDQLGKGAFSVVKRAIDRETREVVALKLIPNDVFLKNKEATEREVAILRNIGDHPHVVKLGKVLRSKQHFAIAMELLTGGELFERICSREAYSENDARLITIQLVQAVAFLHSKNIAHRDLKPENAIFKTPDEHAVLKLTDFGFANVYDPESRFVATCGTPLYVAPEIIDATPYDVQCDMWSLGVIVYILLCGFPPFYGNTDEELYYRIRTASFEYISPNWDGMSNNIKDFINKLFVVDPKKRMTAANALKHPWLLETGDKDHMQQAMEELRRTQYKLKLLKGVYAVIAMNRMARLSAFAPLQA